jgi:hypothetical protein
MSIWFAIFSTTRKRLARICIKERWSWTNNDSAELSLYQWYGTVQACISTEDMVLVWTAEPLIICVLWLPDWECIVKNALARLVQGSAGWNWSMTQEQLLRRHNCWIFIFTFPKALKGLAIPVLKLLLKTWNLPNNHAAGNKTGAQPTAQITDGTEWAVGTARIPECCWCNRVKPHLLGSCDNHMLGFHA